MNHLEKAKKAAYYIREKINFKNINTAVVAGSGLSFLSEILEEKIELSYNEIPYFAPLTAPGHKGSLIFGKINGKNTVITGGRYHYYEGYSMEEVVFPIRVFKYLKVEKLYLTNAAGALNKDYQRGDLMLVKNHINLQGASPLRGPALEDEIRFPLMEKAYFNKEEERQKIIDLGEKHGLNIHEGIYTAIFGPEIESSAEAEYMRRIGGDCVGMSTVPEIIAAVQNRLDVIALSVITDTAGEYNPEVMSEHSMENLMKKLAPGVKGLFKEIL
ncbi:MAG: purine-nucleoside phosphorylase [Bacillota bacterium]